MALAPGASPEVGFGAVDPPARCSVERFPRRRASSRTPIRTGPDWVLGIDIDPKCAEFDGRFSTVRIGSQDDAGFLKDVVREMGGVDIVLDDGSHVASHQRASFETLFPLLSEGGLYIIEDVHTAYWPSFEGGLKRSGTAIEFMKKQIDEMHSHYLNKARNTETAIPPIESIQFFDSVVAVRKRKQAPRGHVVTGGR